MRIGAGFTLVVIGAIIAFAVRDTSDTFNLRALGIIVMLGGAAGLWFSYRLANSRRSAQTTTVIDPAVERQYRTTREDRVSDEPIDVASPREPGPPPPLTSKGLQHVVAFVRVATDHRAVGRLLGPSVYDART